MFLVTTAPRSKTPMPRGAELSGLGETKQREWGAHTHPGRVGNIGPVGYAMWERGLGVAGSSRFSSLSGNLDIEVNKKNWLLTLQAGENMSVDFTGSSDHQHVTSTKIFWATLCTKQLDNSYKIRFFPQTSSTHSGELWGGPGCCAWSPGGCFCCCL